MKVAMVLVTAMVLMVGSICLAQTGSSGFELEGRGFTVKVGDGQIMDLKAGFCDTALLKRLSMVWFNKDDKNWYNSSRTAVNWQGVSKSGVRGIGEDEFFSWLWELNIGKNGRWLELTLDIEARKTFRTEPKNFYFPQIAFDSSLYEHVSYTNDGETAELAVSSSDVFSPQGGWVAFKLKEKDAGLLLIYPDTKPWDGIPYAQLSYQNGIYSSAIPAWDREVQNLQRKVFRLILAPFENDPVSAAENILKTVRSEPAEDTDLAGVPSEPGLTLWHATAHEHIFKEPAPYVFCMKNRAKQPLIIKAARGELEPFQLIVTPDAGKSFQDLSLRFSPLKHRLTQQVIPPEPIDYHLVRYVENYWPDILQPVENLNTDSEERYNYSFWVRISVPDNIPSGNYYGTVTVLSGGKPVAGKDCQLHVWDFTLPKETHTQSALFGIWPNFLRAQFPKASDEDIKRLIKEICISLEEHRLGHGNDTMGPVPFRHDQEYWLTDKGEKEMFEWMDFWDSRGVNIGTVRVVGGTPDETQKDFARRFWQKYYPVFKKKGWIEKMWHQHPDEYRTIERASKYKKEADFIRQIAPGLRIMSTAIGAGLDVHEAAVGGTDIWATELEMYTDPQLLKFFRQRKAAGEEVFWYIHHHITFPMDALALRSLFWTGHREGITGICLYGINVWGKEPILPNKFGLRQESTYVGYPLGGGVLFWPGENRVLESVRLEYLREGLEDCEYFWLLEKNIEQIKKAGELPSSLREKLARLEELQ
ncbi:MAG: glycoside hydrolase domain-containing protein, partial [Planctomycetota bacterium]